MSRGFTPRPLETWVSLCNVMLKLHGFPRSYLSSGRIVSRVTIGRVTPFNPRQRPNANTRYCRLFKATMAYTSTRTDAGARQFLLL